MQVAARELPWTDPARAFVALAADADGGFWLDAGPDARHGFSYLGVGAEFADVPRAQGVAGGGDAPSAAPWGPFSGGWIGWLDYDSAAARAGAPAVPERPAAGVRVTEFIAFDHAGERCWAVGRPGRVDVFADAFVQKLATASDPSHRHASDLRIREVRERHSAAQYARLIERCRDAIAAGDAYQLCLTTRFSIDGEVDAAAAYLRLRAATPAHHGGFIRVGELALVSASPERFIEIADGVVRTHPIKGTRPRGSDAALDQALAAELQASEKERAENVMIVDLMRNDLHRVSVTGSVAVDRLLEVESYAAVHQLVSAVSGRLRPDVTVGDVLDAVFPAGSMTGAPKLSAMTLLHEFEGAPRGVFAGCFGWVGANGDADLAMVIRSIFVHPGGADVGAGGGITWRSVAADEVAEVGLKAHGPLAALGADLPADWGA